MKLIIVFLALLLIASLLFLNHYNKRQTLPPLQNATLNTQQFTLIQSDELYNTQRKNKQGNGQENSQHNANWILAIPYGNFYIAINGYSTEQLCLQNATSVGGICVGIHR